MGEILDFKSHKRMTAMGRFLLAVEQQEKGQLQDNLNAEPTPNPTLAESNLARRELNFIFSGDNKELAEELYKQGLDDVVQKRTPTISIEESLRQLESFANSLHIELFGIASVVTDGKYTEAAMFYIHVQRLTYIANAQHDQLKEVNEVTDDII